MSDQQFFSFKNAGLSRWLQRLVLLLVFLAGIGIRLYDFTDPPLEFHLTRQLRSALIARQVYINLLPDATPEQKTMAADTGALEVYEPPILESMVGGLYVVFGGENIAIPRTLNAIFWALGGWFLYLLLRRSNGFIAIVSALTFYFFLPFSVIASRSFQPDPWMVTWILATTWSAVRWHEQQNWKNSILTGILAGITVLVKGFAGLFVAPLLIVMVLATCGLRKTVKSVQVWIMALLSALPMLSYYLVLNSGRSGDFLSFWAGSLSGLVLTSNFYADWLAMLKGLMGLFTIVAALLGTLLAAKDTKCWLLPLWVGYFLFGMVFPYQFTTHEYYHLALLPLVTAGLAGLFNALLPVLKNQHWIWRLAVIGILLAASGYNLYVARSMLVVNNYRHEPAAWQQIAAAIPEKSTFISLSSDYGMRLRYFGWRVAKAEWPTAADLHLFSLAGNADLDTLAYFREQTAGADYFVITAFQELDNQPVLKQVLEENYPLSASGDGYLIYDLMHPLTDGVEQ
jgi:4-amino-4-deoxy-L-arabinose transferase-like glycosyltransferase